jgi:hypothetical protein
MFVLNVLNDSGLVLSYMRARHAIIVTTEKPGGTFCLVDVVAVDIPPLCEIIAALGVQPLQIEILFPPDKLAWTGAPVPASNSTVLTVRGEFTMAEPIGLPPTAAF